MKHETWLVSYFHWLFYRTLLSKFGRSEITINMLYVVWIRFFNYQISNFIKLHKHFQYPESDFSLKYYFSCARYHWSWAVNSESRGQEAACTHIFRPMQLLQWVIYTDSRSKFKNAVAQLLLQLSLKLLQTSRFLLSRTMNSRMD